MKKVLLLLAEGFEPCMANAFIDVIGLNMMLGDGSSQLFTCGLRHEIESSLSQRVVTDYLVCDINPELFDALVIPGGFEKLGFYNDAYDESLLVLIRMFDAQNKIIASVCVGALPIALSGILSNHKIIDSIKRTIIQNEPMNNETNIINEPITNKSNVIISWKPYTALDLAFLLLERLTSKEQSILIREIMEFRLRQN